MGMVLKPGVNPPRKDELNMGRIPGRIPPRIMRWA
jgi:hypothetical protein